MRERQWTPLTTLQKRCIHQDDGGRPGTATDAARKPGASADDEDATQVAANRLMELSSSRFISDLNPEGMFIQAATPALKPEGGSTYRDKNDLGVWLPPYSQRQQEDGGSGSGGDGDDDEEPEGAGDSQAQNQTAGNGAQMDDSARNLISQFGGMNGLAAHSGGANGSQNGSTAGTSGTGTTHAPKQRRRSRNHRRPNFGGRSAVSEAALIYERAKYTFVKECLTIYPPDEDFAVLHRIYCEKVHPLLPVLKDADLQRASTTPMSPSPAPTAIGNGTGTSASPSKSTPTSQSSYPAHPPQTAFTASIFPTVVKQIIALSAATTDQEAAAAHLRLEPNGPLLTPREFHHRLTDAVSTILDADMIPHRFDYIRATILLSFFYQPSAEVDRNKPSFLCTQAVHHFQTIGAHLLGYRPEQPDDDVERVFCALWALDRLASVLYARPCMMHAYDNGKDPEQCLVNQPPCFRLFMSVILWLDKVIHLYRPRQPFVMIDIPVYEALILDAQAEKLPSMLLGTIEILYHTVCVLSCRQPLSAFTDVSDVSTLNRDDRTYLPISIMNPRRSHSSDRIVWVTQTQPICLFPFVPYAVSIALSVQYKKMRYSRTPLFRTRARVGFKDIVALLRSMGDVFINARVNAALGESIWRQMEKTATTLAREELEAGAGGSGTTAATGAMGPPPVPETAKKTTNLTASTPAPTATTAPAFVSSSSSVSSAAAPTTLTGGTAPTVTPAPTATASDLQQHVPQTGHSEFVYDPTTTTVTAANSTPTTMHLSSGAGVIAPIAEGVATTTTQAVHPPLFPPAQLPPLTQQPLPEIDLSVLDSLDTDIDLFGNFDPSFDLGAIDTALEANLDMAIPQNWTPWNNLV
ncbi:hypothetical protein Sste5346_009900 [Sporothrix stenoceras]|uniref:Transcription factor domain-containing protein n=1 Tax=Sporothrix stenoceras TaxID=5173 RepID=A0ABR3YHY8_9PEZI